MHRASLNYHFSIEWAVRYTIILYSIKKEEEKKHCQLNYYTVLPNQSDRSAAWIDEREGNEFPDLAFYRGSFILPASGSKFKSSLPKY